MRYNSRCLPPIQFLSVILLVKLDFKMKVVVMIIFAVAAVECRKIVPINKNANIDFINMESGGQRPPGPARPASGPAPVNTVPASPTPVPPAKVPSPSQSPKAPEPVPQSPKNPSPASPVTPKPAVAPQAQPTQLDLKPVPSKSGPGAGPSTPGYGKVKDLVTYYDSQGKASVIRPYSYSQAVKQG